MSKVSRRSFLASTVKAALFAGLYPHTPLSAASLPWRNWSGGLQCQPLGRHDIQSEEQLAGILASNSGPIRPVGSGHSFSPLVPTDGHLVIIDQLSGVLAHDAQTHRATLGAGSRLGDIGPQLESLGQGMFNLPDIDRQTLAGATATGTHGTGVGLMNLSAYVDWLRLLTPSGEVLDIDATDADLFNAARVNLGSLGVVTQMRLRNREAYKLKKREWAAPTEDILQNFDELAASHRHFEIFPLVYSDYSMVLSIDESDDEIGQQVLEVDPDEAALISQLRAEAARSPAAQRRAILNRLAADTQPTEAVDKSYKLLSNVRSTPFNEMEYSVPIEVGADCVREILQTIFDREIDVVFPLEYRYVSGDDCWLSMSQGVEPHATISIHRMARADYKPYFDIIEPIFWKYGGRPHWGKIHSLGYKELSALYPHYDDFLEIRRSLDPKGRMLNPHLRKLFNL